MQFYNQEDAIIFIYVYFISQEEKFIRISKQG